MFDITENYKVAREIAAQGIVLLKNENCALPFNKGDRIGVAGDGCLDMIVGGGGSSMVKCEYRKNLLDGICEKVREGKFRFFEQSVAMAEEIKEYDDSQLNIIAENTDKVIVVLKRFATEGGDRLCGANDFCGDAAQAEDYAESVGCYYPSKSEITLLEKIQNSNIKEIILLLNFASTVDVSFIERFSKIKAVLFTYFPGMECGAAVADVLCGDVNPSGKLVDTIAYDYGDYPSSDCFNKDKYNTDYNEGIFVGYRYFETYAKEKVMFPFGFGLSYTTFDYENCGISVENDTVIVNTEVRNSGNVAGREVVQFYVSAPEGKLKKPAVELKGFAKTALLQPGEAEKVTVKIKLSEMASFNCVEDDENCGAWVLEKGEYKIFAGKSSRDLILCGVFAVEETIVAEKLSIRFDGSPYVKTISLFNNEEFEPYEGMSLYHVSEGKITLVDFINRLTAEELVSLSLGQAIGFPAGTSGIGNLRKYDVPNPQTADGPAGIRCSVNSTCFPCSTLVACSWDSELQYKMGKALGVEAYSMGLDVLLGPAMNIHRDPLAGRNFEYFSEDPYVSGKTAAVIVKGMQSEGLCATVKHFAVNNREDFRNVNSSNVDERTLREIYLKGFEIAVKESNPAFMMSSYNLLNGIHTSAHAQLLRGVLRDEWGWDGAVMTDWRNGVGLVDEVIAGNNLKMPIGYPDEGEKVLEAYENGIIPLATLRENAYFVLNAVMKTRSFVEKDFGIIHKLSENSLEIPVMKVNGLASARIDHATREDGVEYLFCLNREQRNQRSFVYYIVDTEDEGRYRVTAQISTNCPQTQIWFFDENSKKVGTAYCDAAIDENKWYDVSTEIYLNRGENMLKLVFANEPDREYEFFDPGPEIPNEWAPPAKEDIRLAKLTLTKMG